jgi:hypothetical protein
MKKIILISTFAILGFLVLGQTVYAATSILSVYPASASKNVSATFDVAVQINPKGDKVCVMKGMLVFNNLTCKSITLASGIMAQTAPTCANPSFILGIPKCATAPQNLLTVSIKGNSAGQAKLSFTEAKIIGAGTALDFITNNGTYNITAVKTTVPKAVIKTTLELIEPLEPTARLVATTTIASEIATLTPETITSTPLFDIVAQPVLPTRPSALLLIVFYVAAGILFILLIIFMIAKRRKKKIILKKKDD